jgi:hypothetical protein
MNQNKNNNLINETFETFTIEFFIENSEYIMHSFWIDYQQRPFFFGYFSPYESSRKTNKNQQYSQSLIPLRLPSMQNTQYIWI